MCRFGERPNTMRCGSGKCSGSRFAAGLGHATISFSPNVSLRKPSARVARRGMVTIAW